MTFEILVPLIVLYTVGAVAYLTSCSLIYSECRSDGDSNKTTKYARLMLAFPVWILALLWLLTSSAVPAFVKDVMGKN